MAVAMLVDNPKEVGADRIVNAIAVQHLHGSPAIVVAFETATPARLATHGLSRGLPRSGGGRNRPTPGGASRHMTMGITTSRCIRSSWITCAESRSTSWPYFPINPEAAIRVDPDRQSASFVDVDETLGRRAL